MSVERTVTVVTSVSTLAEAWAFVMQHLDEAGTRPRIEISPKTLFSASMDDDRAEELFEVTVSGMVVNK